VPPRASAIIDAMTRAIDRIPTAPLAAAGLIGGFGVAVGSGSRPLGGVVLAAFGLTCAWVWARRDGRRTAVTLTGAGLIAFAGSHVLGLVIGAWPSVFAVSAAMAALCWWRSDSRRPALVRAETDPVPGRAA
jgi:tetrahydromethanopterin S-methyltransferase subunit C